MNDMLREIIGLLTLQDVVFISGSGAVVITTFIQKMSNKYKPWTWLANQFGKAVNKEMFDRLDELETKIDNLEKRDSEQDARREEDKAKSARRRILRCADEIRSKQHHSEEYFNDVMDDITYYTNYCKEHPEFKNKKAVMAIELVEKIYKKCMEENDFL